MSQENSPRKDDKDQKMECTHTRAEISGGKNKHKHKDDTMFESSPSLAAGIGIGCSIGRADVRSAEDDESGELPKRGHRSGMNVDDRTNDSILLSSNKEQPPCLISWKSTMVGSCKALVIQGPSL